MKKLLCLIPLVALLASSCASNPTSLALVQAAVTTGVEFGLLKATNAGPYVAAAGAVICASAASTNVSPEAVVAALEASDAAKLKTPEAVLIINGSLAIYDSVWSALGTNTTKAAPYLQAVCNGINAALPPTPSGPVLAKKAKLLPPHVL